MRLSLILPPALADHAGELVDHPRAVAADRRNGQVLLHLLWVAGYWLAVCSAPSVPGAGRGCDLVPGMRRRALA